MRSPRPANLPVRMHRYLYHIFCGAFGLLDAVLVDLCFSATDAVVRSGAELVMCVAGPTVALRTAGAAVVAAGTDDCEVDRSDSPASADGLTLIGAEAVRGVVDAGAASVSWIASSGVSGADCAGATLAGGIDRDAMLDVVISAPVSGVSLLRCASRASDGVISIGGAGGTAAGLVVGDDIAVAISAGLLAIARYGAMADVFCAECWGLSQPDGATPSDTAPA
jgi:hypothetical protein